MVVYIRILVASFMRFCDQVMRDVITESRGVCHDFLWNLLRDFVASHKSKNLWLGT